MEILKKSDYWDIGVSKVVFSEYGASRLRSTTHIPLDDPYSARRPKVGLRAERCSEHFDQLNDHGVAPVEKPNHQNCSSSRTWKSSSFRTSSGVETGET
jgi:hypothetical protein